MSQVLVKVIVAVLYGIVLGIVTIPISRKLTLSRTDDPVKASPLNKVAIKILAVVIGIGASVAIVLTNDDIDLMVRNLVLLIPIFSISFVDSLVRKIPNSLLLVMLGVEAVYLIYHCVSTKDTDIIGKAFMGLFVGFIVCYIPNLLKVPVGAGDVKYNAVIGVCLYIVGYIQSMVFMGVFVAIYYLFLKITKKGSIKSMIPMGPFFSIGIVISMCFSIFDLLNLAI
jgi:leader peptidase (prepilin peptidase)/N-methyltransferase